MMHALVMIRMRMVLHRLGRRQRLHDARRAEHQLQLTCMRRKHEASWNQRPQHQQREDPETQQFEVMATHDNGPKYTPDTLEPDTFPG